MRLRRIALLLAVLGLLCLPAPLYLGWAAEATAPPPRTSQVFEAEPLDPANESDRETIVERHGTVVALSTHRISESYSAGEYRAPNETRRTLETAMGNGSATTADSGAQADLRRIAGDYAFVYDAYGDREQYYRLGVTGNGSEVRARNVSVDRVANATVEQSAVSYAALSPDERRTVDRIVDNSSDDYGYRPRTDEAFVDRLPALVERDGTLYSVHSDSHVDDFGPGFGGFLVGLAVAAAGAVLLVAGAVTYAVAWRRSDAETTGDGTDRRPPG